MVAAASEIRSIVFACDAGMGSSAMGASVLRKKIQAAGHGDVTVVNKAISNLNDSYDLVVTHQDLTDRARQKTPSAIHVSVDNFMGSPRYDEIVELLDQSSSGGAAEAPADESAASWRRRARARVDRARRTGPDPRRGHHRGRPAARCGRAPWTRRTSTPCTSGRSRSRPTWATASPSRTAPTRPSRSIRHTAISFVRYDEPVDWNGKPAEFVLGIAGAGDDHLALLSRIAETFVDADRVAQLRAATSADDVLAVLDVVRV